MPILFLPVRTQRYGCKDIRERESEASLARSHAAAVAHARAKTRLQLKRRCECCPSRQGHTCHRAATPGHQGHVFLEYGLEDERISPNPAFAAHPLPTPVCFKGNSDPFNCAGVAVGAQLNHLLAFARDAGVPALFKPLIIRSMEARTGADIYTYMNINSIRLFTSDIYRALRDEGSALARLLTYANALGKCVNQDEPLRMMALHMRRRSTTLLRTRVAEYISTPTDHLRESLAQQVFGFLDADGFEGDREAARTHAKVLVTLYPKQSTPVTTYNRVCHVNVYLAIRTGRRTLSEIDEWCLPPMLEVLHRTRDATTVPADDSRIHHTVSCPILRKLFARRGRVLATLTEANLKTMHPNLLLHQSFLISVDLHCMIQICHDLMDDAISPTMSKGQRWTQLALCQSLLGLHVMIYGDFTVNNQDVRDITPLIIRRLQHAYIQACAFSSDAEATWFLETRTWILYIIVLMERALQLSPNSSHPKNTAFDAQLVQHARTAKITKWRTMRDLAHSFFYTDLIEPDGCLWFEVLLHQADLGADDSSMGPSYPTFA